MLKNYYNTDSYLSLSILICETEIFEIQKRPKCHEFTLTKAKIHKF